MVHFSQHLLRHAGTNVGGSDISVIVVNISDLYIFYSKSGIALFKFAIKNYLLGEL